jgi:CubicO group peptidase (beta-lactamase class C family)
MSTRFIASLALVFVVTHVGCTPWLTDVEEFANPEQEISRAVETSRIPSLATWVIRDGAIVWEQYYGMADLDRQRPTDRNTVYDVASVSKLVVVTAVMQLHEQNMIDLDADIDSYLPFSVRNPGFSEEAITAHHLLTHTSGLNWPESDSEVPGFYDEYPMDSAPPLAVWLPRFLLPEGEHFVPTVWLGDRPGSREYYSNIGVALLAYIVEVVSGMDFNDYCKENIFEPLEMLSTSYAYDDLNLDEVATAYSPGRAPIPYSRSRAYPSGALKTTVEDFSHFIIAYMNRGRYGTERILSEATVDEILTMRNAASGTALIWQRRYGDWFGHAGGKDGVAAYVEFQRESKVGLMVVANYRHLGLPLRCHREVRSERSR